MDSKPRKRFKQIQWVDTDFRFLAKVSVQQDNPPFVRMDISVPTVAQTSVHDSAHVVSEEDIFIPIQEVILLHPYQPGNAMLLANPSLYEVAVRVDNFWSASQSGGNSGRPVRHGTMYVSGEVEVLQRLLGQKDKRFTSRQSRPGGVDGSGVRGLTHILQGGINLRRLRTFERSSVAAFHSKWVCIDYSITHRFHCLATPKCTLRSGREPSVVNMQCFKRGNLVLKRQWDNVHDKNAIAIVSQGLGTDTIVGFAPRELAACLAPAMDALVASVNTKGVYSEIDVAGDKCHRVWFCVKTGNCIGGVEQHSIQAGLRAIPWWVVDTDTGGNPSSVEVD
jgi:hypothetical protein